MIEASLARGAVDGSGAVYGLNSSAGLTKITYAPNALTVVARRSLPMQQTLAWGKSTCLSNSCTFP